MSEDKLVLCNGLSRENEGERPLHLVVQSKGLQYFKCFGCWSKVKTLGVCVLSIILRKSISS